MIFFPQNFAVALSKRGITVNAISPSWTEDSVLNSMPQGVRDLIRNWHKQGWTPMGRLGTPEDVGDVVSILCSERASWITGQVIYADGGASLMTYHLPARLRELHLRRHLRIHIMFVGRFTFLLGGHCWLNFQVP
jgi:enoyl-[acyl-carrier-protein] reductase (NADH)